MTTMTITINENKNLVSVRIQDVSVSHEYIYNNHLNGLIELFEMIDPRIIKFTNDGKVKDNFINYIVDKGYSIDSEGYVRFNPITNMLEKRIDEELEKATTMGIQVKSQSNFEALSFILLHEGYTVTSTYSDEVFTLFATK